VPFRGRSEFRFPALRISLTLTVPTQLWCHYLIKDFDLFTFYVIFGYKNFLNLKIFFLGHANNFFLTFLFFKTLFLQKNFQTSSLSSIRICNSHLNINSRLNWNSSNFLENITWTMKIYYTFVNTHLLLLKREKN